MKRSKGFGPLPAEQPGRQLLQLLKTAQQQQQAGRLAEAEAIYCQVLDTHPDQPDALHNLGLVTYLQGNPFTAELPLRRLLAQQPRNAEVHSNLGAVLEAQGRSVEAEASCRQALALKSNRPETYSGLGNALMSQGQLDAALASHRQALALKPDYAEAYNNQGNILFELGQYVAALDAYQQALQLQPGLADAHANQAYVHLLLGNFEAGWHKYEWRWRTGHARGRAFTQPTWDGSDPSGKTLLLHAEQGFGDTIQFVRYVSRLRARGATIFVLCRPQERRLLRTCAGIDTLVVQNESLPEFDAHAPLASLPGLMGTELMTIPADIPYLHAPATCTLPEALQQQLQSTDGCKIGLVWSATRLRYADRKRGFPLHLWQALFALPGIYWFSLYKGEQGYELEPYPQVIDVGTHCSDFADTAWAISRLDLVISVDTAVAHLAGALGKPTWVLLPFVPDWRWLLEREDSPWYPSVRLFRQPALGDWHSVIARVEEGLQKLTGTGQMSALQVHNVLPVQQPPSDLSRVIDRASQLATQHQEADRLQQAGAIYDWILQVQPDHCDALNNLGMLIYKLGNGAAALPLLRRAATLRPKDAYLQFNLAQVLQAVGDLDGAQICCMQAATLEPEFAEAFNTLGNLQAAQGQLLAAETNYRRALALRPDFAGTCNNLGNVLQQLGRYNEALACYRQALVQKPDLADAHYNLSISHLLMGRFEPGWQAYEWRWQSGGLQPRHSGATWDGTDPTGKTVLLWAEQGYGDAIQFIRYVAPVKARGARILLECRPAERRLFESCAGIDHLVLAGEMLPTYDVQVPLMSLPRLLNTTLDTIPVQVPYLNAPAVCHLPEALQRLLLGASGLKVGLVWAATAERFEDRKRCCPLPIWEPLLAMAGVSWFSLYQGEQRYELEPYPQVIDVGMHCSDFADTAWALSRLDLVISVDTAVAHLAGALGKPTWVLLPFVPDWRWLLEREDSPWYPSVRLFRQSALGEWPSVIDQVRTALNAHPHWSGRIGTPQ